MTGSYVSGLLFRKTKHFTKDFLFLRGVPIVMKRPENDMKCMAVAFMGETFRTIYFIMILSKYPLSQGFYAGQRQEGGME